MMQLTLFERDSEPLKYKRSTRYNKYVMIMAEEVKVTFAMYM